MMQHMAIVKDYQLPIPADPPVLDLLAATFKTTAPKNVQLTFRSTPGASYEVQASTNLSPNPWTTLGSLTASSTSTAVTIIPTTPGSGQVQDPLLATAPRRFYRIQRR